MNERQRAAERLKDEAMEIAAAFETIAYEDDQNKVKKAQDFLRTCIDGYWHAVVIGDATSIGEVLAE